MREAESWWCVREAESRWWTRAREVKKVLLGCRCRALRLETFRVKKDKLYGSWERRKRSLRLVVVVERLSEVEEARCEEPEAGHP